MKTTMVELHWDTYTALKQIRDDYGPGTFDLVLKKLIQSAYPGQFDLIY